MSDIEIRSLQRLSAATQGGDREAQAKLSAAGDVLGRHSRPNVPSRTFQTMAEPCLPRTNTPPNICIPMVAF